MNKRVMTSDGVPWEVRRLSPLQRSDSSVDGITIEQKDHIGFEALFMILLSATLVLTLPIIVQSEYRWLALLVVPLVGVTWFMYLASWQVLMLRENTLVLRTTVRGRAPAAKLVAELVAEIARTPDEKLHR